MPDEEVDIRTCPVCGKEIPRNNMNFTRDCQGITMRLVCWDCYDNIMNNEPFYDGQYYDERDECLDEDY